MRDDGASLDMAEGIKARVDAFAGRESLLENEDEQSDKKALQKAFK